MEKNTIIKIAVPVVVVILFVLGYFLLFSSEPIEEPEVVEEEIFTKEEAELLAEEWIKNYSPTYQRDGHDLNLRETEEIEQGVYEMLFTFIKPTSGWGDGKDEEIHQMPHGHRLEIVVERGEVVSVINDNHFDEMKNERVVREHVDPSISLYFVKEINGRKETVKAERTIVPGHAEQPPEYVPETEEDFFLLEAEFFIEELLKGPSNEKKEQGIFTAIPSGTELLNVSIEKEVLLLDFNEKLEAGAKEKENRSLIREQIVNTTEEAGRFLSEVLWEEVIITIEGKDSF